MMMIEVGAASYTVAVARPIASAWAGGTWFVHDLILAGCILMVAAGRGGRMGEEGQGGGSVKTADWFAERSGIRVIVAG